MSSETPGPPRGGKYCPRCRTMARRDEAVCRQCGHQFRSGVAQAGPETPAPDPLNRTMQFTMPSLPTRTPPSPALGRSPSPALGRSPRQAMAVAAAVLTIAALCLGAFVFWSGSQRGPAVPETSPVGHWETVLHGSAAANARLEFVFEAGGGGAFSWQESGVIPHAGRTLLHWKQNLDGTLFLTLDRPADGDQVAQILCRIFSRPAWTWRVDRAQHRFVLGTLVFTEKH